MSATERSLPRRRLRQPKPPLRSARRPPADRTGAAPERARLAPGELVVVALQGLGTRRLRAALSALGIAIGIGAMVAVVGVSSSAQANLIAEIDRLGTNLLTVSPGQTAFGGAGALPDTAAPMIAGMRGVTSAAASYQVAGADVYRMPLVPSQETGGIGVEAAGDALPRVVETRMTSGHFLGPVAERYPQVVLGSEAARTLQITSASGHLMLYVGNHWFTVIGVMAPVALDSSLNADVFISLPLAERDFGVAPQPSEIYVRTTQNDVSGVADLLAATANPQEPSGISVTRPSNLLEARAAAKGQFTTLLLGLGAVALLVGAIGIANIMVISVLERRGEIGLRRALGATRAHISLQFLSESALLAAVGGLAGLALGAGATDVYAAARHEPFVVPLYALIAAPSAGLAIGALAGLYPAAKAARLSPTKALRAS
jgi:putative ABC transport system permease protein